MKINKSQSCRGRDRSASLSPARGLGQLWGRVAWGLGCLWGRVEWGFGEVWGRVEWGWVVWGRLLRGVGQLWAAPSRCHRHRAPRSRGQRGRAPSWGATAVSLSCGIAPRDVTPLGAGTGGSGRGTGTTPGPTPQRCSPRGQPGCPLSGSAVPPPPHYIAPRSRCAPPRPFTPHPRLPTPPLHPLNPLPPLHTDPPPFTSTPGGGVPTLGARSPRHHTAPPPHYP